MKNDVDALIRAASEIVQSAGSIALDHFRVGVQVEDKRLHGVFDPVTEADRKIELFVREKLAQLDDTLAVVGEEFGRSGSGDSYWIIDPIDGTRAFICGVPLWGTLLGLVINGVPVGSIMYQPFTKELYVSDSSGPRLVHEGRTTRLKTSSCTQIEEATVYSLDPRIIERINLSKPFWRLVERAKLLRWGGDCYSFAMVAHGCVDLVVDGGLEAYDIVPLIHLIESAGGVVTDLHGNRPMNGGTLVAAANPQLHQAALDVLNNTDSE